MTATELIEKIEIAGGVLTLKADKIGARIPSEKAELLELLRTQRAAVLELLRQRAVAWVGSWLAINCVGARGTCANPRILYREYCRWGKGQANTITYEAFLGALETNGWRLDERGMVADLCLFLDFLVALEHGREQQKQLLM